MSKTPESTPGILVKAARIFLGAFFLICVGYNLASVESISRALKYYTSYKAVLERRTYAKDPLDKQLTVWSRAPHALEGGALLIGSEYSQNLALMLVDEQGHILHRWQAENKLFNPNVLQWWKTIAMEEGFSLHDALLQPNGDVIFIQKLMDVNNFSGQRLARMDRDSNILWQVPGNFNHFIEIAGNPQHIYVPDSRLVKELPEVGPKLNNTSYLEDWIVAFTLDGRKINEWSVVDAFARSPYRHWLTSFAIDPDMDDVQRIEMPDGRVLYDLFHLNSVQYLDAVKARALPGAIEGDLLLSFRGLNALAVLRPSTRQIVWAAKGPWQHQHNVRVGNDGKLYIYDNEGKRVVTSYDGRTPTEAKLTRLVTYNPFNGQLDEIWSGQDLYSAYLGYYYHLPNGSWILSSPQHASIFVVSPEKAITWMLRTVPDPTPGEVPHRKQISTVHYYSAAELSFLKISETTQH